MRKIRFTDDWGRRRVGGTLDDDGTFAWGASSLDRGLVYWAERAVVLHPETWEQIRGEVRQLRMSAADTDATYVLQDPAETARTISTRMGARVAWDLDAFTVVRKGRVEAPTPPAPEPTPEPEPDPQGALW